MTHDRVVMMGVRLLRAPKRKTRTHSKKQIRQIVNLVLCYGWTYPILVDEDGIIICGYGRYLAALELGLKEVPTIVMSGLSDAKKRLLTIADNKIPTNAGWDYPVLAAELGELAVLLPECQLNIELSGFEAAEIDSLMSDHLDSEREPGDVVPEMETKAVSRIGDLWTLSKHRLLCGDSREPGHIKTLMGTARAFMVFTDPPYNVRVSSIQGRGRIKHREFAAASGEMSRAQFTEFLTQWIVRRQII